MQIDEKALQAAIAWYWRAGAISENIPRGCIREYLANLPKTDPKQREREACGVDEVAEVIRTADNGLDGDPLCALLDESPHIDMATSNRAEADEMILRVCRSIAADLMNRFDIRRRGPEHRGRE